MQENTPLPVQKEYPERETYGTVWYPPSFHKLSSREIWRKRDIGFYVHIPFCKTVCKYCPFNKYAWNPEKVERYVQVLKKEICTLSQQPYILDSQIIAGYFGGGTPTSLSIGQLETLFDICNEHFTIHKDVEMSIEANPETVTQELLEFLYGKGINRISFGVQSFNNETLKLLGRAHSAQEAFNAIELARKVGFENIGIDLLYCIPGQTLKDWERELEQALQVQIDHISTIALFIDPSTALFYAKDKGTIPPQADETTDIAMYEFAVDKLTKQGYHLYTMYDFAIPGKECVHHSINWEAPQREYIGLGAGAYSYIHEYIYTNLNPLEEYMEAVEQGEAPVSYGTEVSIRDKMSRFMVLGVYFLNVNKLAFKQQFGIGLDEVYGDMLQQLEGYGLLENSADYVKLTPKGLNYIYSVSNAFYSPEHKGKPQPIGVELQKGEGSTLQGIEGL